MKFGSFIGLGLVLAGLALGTIYGREALKFELASPGQRLGMIWSNDIKSLYEAGRLPPGWTDVREILLTPATETAKEWVKDLEVPIPVKSQGQHKLEILVISWDEGSNFGAIIMHHLLDANTNNTIWELSRTYTLKQETQTTPMEEPTPSEK